MEQAYGFEAIAATGTLMRRFELLCRSNSFGSKPGERQQGAAIRDGKNDDQKEEEDRGEM
jgi:hypothetical protein